LLRLAGRALLAVLTRTEVTGLDRFPSTGPLLVVGNHVAAVEVALMIAYSPWQIEMLGPGDIPPPPLLNAIARAYGFTAINRGNVDRRPLVQMLSVLQQGGRVGLFPEGGVWDPGSMQAKRGVAWLSHRARAPVLPIGFGGLEGALDAAFRLKRPRLTMNVGQLMPPVSVAPGQSRKDALQQAAVRIMEAVNALVPGKAQEDVPQVVEERFELRIALLARDGSGAREEQVSRGEALCKMLYRPAILRIFARDLHLEVDALQQLDAEQDPVRIVSATDTILHYLESRNPGFFTYRFGHAEGQEMEEGLRELRALARRAAAQNLRVAVTPVRRYRVPGHAGEVVETSPGEAHTW
jgi:1-acyl-sn-glycerol-3-phosphate acyltransferase